MCWATAATMDTPPDPSRGLRLTGSTSESPKLGFSESPSTPHVVRSGLSENQLLGLQPARGSQEETH